MLKNLKFATKQTFFYSIGNFATKAAGFILLPLFTKHLPLSDYGLLALFEVLGEFISQISSLGIDNGFKRWYWAPETQGKQGSLFFTTYLFSVLSSLCCLSLSAMFIYRYSDWIFDTDISISLIYVFLGANFARMLTTKILFLMRNQQKALANAFSNIFRLTLVIGSSIYFIGYKEQGISGVFQAQIVGNVALFLALFPYLIKNVSFHIEKKLFVDIFRFSLPLALSGILALVLTLSDRYILNIFGGLEDVGNYSLAYKISNILKLLIVQSFVQAFVFIFFKKMNDESNYRFFAKAITYFSFSILFLGLCLAMFSKEIITLLAERPEYILSYQIIPFLIFAIFFNGLRQLFYLPLSQHKKIKIMFFIPIIIGSGNILLNLLLIPRFHAVGAALATLLAQLSGTILNLYFVQKISNIPYEIKKISMLTVLTVVVLCVASITNPWPLGWRLIAKLLFAAIFPILLYFFHFYEPIELLRLQQSWQKWRNPKRWKENLRKINLK